MEFQDDGLVVVLSERLSNLERLVFGSQDKDTQYPKCIESLSKVNAHLSTMAAGRDKVSEAFNKASELDALMDAGANDELTMPPTVKADVVINEEDRLRQIAADLETIQKLSHVLDSEHIKAVPALSDQLQLLSQKQLEQQDGTAVLTDDTKRLISAYNNIITTLSKQFVQWDDTLTKLEVSQQGSDQGQRAVYPSL